MEKKTRYAAIWFDHAVRFDVIMTLVFFNNLHTKHGFENNQFQLVAIRPNSWKTLKVLAIFEQ